HHVRDTADDLVALRRLHRPGGLRRLPLRAAVDRDRGARIHAHARPPSSLPPIRRNTPMIRAAKSSVITARITPIAVARPNWPFSNAVRNRYWLITSVLLPGPPVEFRPA